MFVIDWRNLRSLNNSQNTAFEELCCQLAEYEKPLGAAFYRKGTPDAGVECFIVLHDKSEWGWQAKYFLSMDNSQWVQLDDSVKTALEKHPRLARYTICIPLDRSDARIEGQKSLLKRWHERVEKWTKWATNVGMQVQFEYWGSYEILERLSREAHRGRFFFWFGKELFGQSWFEVRLNEAVDVAGPRYTPPIHVELPIAQLFDGLARTSDFYIRVKHLLRDIKKDYSWIRLLNKGTEFDEAAIALHEHAQQLFSMVIGIDNSLTDTIPWESIANQAIQTRQAAHDCLERLEELRKKTREDRKNEPANSPGDQESQDYNNTRHHIYSFIGKVRTLENFAQSLEARLSNLPAFLLCGEAGQGKTHLFCDVATRRIKAGLPTVLLMGQRFTQVEPWIQIIRQLSLSENTTREEFLGGLQAAAQAKNAKALIMIDALNEGEGKRIWNSHLPAMLQTISRYPWISIAVSVRTSYEHVVIAEDLVDEKLIRAKHHGFAEHEYQATRTFFDYYGIEQPTIPLLVPEFQNPLFLKLLCKGLRENNQTKIPVGLQGITSVFQLFVDAVNKKLSNAAFCNFNPRRMVVWQAIDRLADVMAEGQKDWLLLEEAEDITNQLLPDRGYENSLFRHLVSEGILVENGRWLSQDKWAEVVQFAYERFSDHLIVQHLLDKYLNSNIPEQAFLPNQPLSFLSENEWRHRGLIEALCIQMPERIGKELPEVVPIMADFHPVARGFIESIIWRNPKAITDITRHYLNKYINQLPDANDWVLNALLTVATNPDHPYNADFLHARLMKDEMAERDVWWSIFLHEQYGLHDAVDRLIDWAWSSESKSSITDESIRLCGIALAWFLTTSNRFLRDRATKALVNLFTPRIHVLRVVLEKFLGVNDPYILERLFAVAYGCTLRSANNQQIGVLAQAIYDWIFREGKPPIHILLRDYARGVIEYAIHKGIELNIEVDKIRPPYQSEWLSDIPEPDEIEQYHKWWEDMPQAEWARVAIYSSVMEHGDFGRYIIEHNVHHWSSLRLDESRWRSSKEKLKEFVDSLTEKQHKKWEQYQDVYQQRQKYWWSMQGNVTKLTDEELQVIIDSVEENHEAAVQNQQPDEHDEVLSELETFVSEITMEEQGFCKTLGKKKLKIFEEQILPYLNDSIRDDSPPYFDLSIAQRWIVKQVFEIGWSIELFGWFDRNLDRNNFREARKAERIGKKSGMVQNRLTK